MFPLEQEHRNIQSWQHLKQVEPREIGQQMILCETHTTQGPDDVGERIIPRQHQLSQCLQQQRGIGFLWVFPPKLVTHLARVPKLLLSRCGGGPILRSSRRARLLLRCVACSRVKSYIRRSARSNCTSGQTPTTARICAEWRQAVNKAIVAPKEKPVTYRCVVLNRCVSAWISSWVSVISCSTVMDWGAIALLNDLPQARWSQ